ncbi:MAG: hypothetical protein JETT_0246 [Candidatus Jettenia ecosi]|uniref:Uncharacterized protein n=1 Tax=Candidatus Jettenia ecosi TaxID=2494326 RepID=A0A533QF75_9BACT|nr:MAG: hypothetical protein JETT_0246 [Candidatus Jettenia ecosi]
MKMPHVVIIMSSLWDWALFAGFFFYNHFTPSGFIVFK